MSTPVFISPSVESVKYRNSTVTNNPVNLSLCRIISKDQMRWYPDNTGIPCIKFEGCDAMWVYDTVVSRDVDFDRIIKRFT